MSKAHRGKGILDQFAHGRGNCPVCDRSGVKILYEQEAGGQKFKICKICRAAIKSGKKKLPVVEVTPPPAEAPKPAAEAPKAAVETPAPTETEVKEETPPAEA
ncbi:MAG: hypothetical protein FWD13_03795 [Treponema sp.]|nr:hypothetical protein [Treponema sp.]